jgi:hypothetical protein
MPWPNLKTSLILTTGLACILGAFYACGSKKDDDSTNNNSFTAIPTIFTRDPYYPRPVGQGYHSHSHPPTSIKEIISAGGMTSEVYRIIARRGDGSTKVLANELITYSDDNPDLWYIPKRDLHINVSKDITHFARGTNFTVNTSGKGGLMPAGTDGIVLTPESLRLVIAQAEAEQRR